MNLSPAGLDALKLREGFAPTQYPDHKGYSIGYGHLILPTDPYNADTVLSEAEAAQILAGDVSWAESAVANKITAPLSQNQFDALVSFCFNVGAGAFGGSTLVRRINANDPGAADEFARWVIASGVVNESLVTRRRSEVTQFLS
jgi:lysozyme